MMRNLKYTAVLAAAALAVAALFAACSTDPVEEAGVTDPTDPTPLPLQSDLPIRLNIKEVTSRIDTRSLIGNDRASGDPEGSTDPNNPNYFIPLSDACRTNLATDPLKEKGFAIGLFSDYYYIENNKDTVRVKDLYRGTRLVYLSPPTAETEDKIPPSGWDTNVAPQYWHVGAKYIFRAYYPQRLYNYTISNSDATTLALVYPSRKLQYDLLIGAKVVDTRDDNWRSTDAVSLQMNHALAALRFEFKLNFEDADILTSVYLLNDEESHFFTQGTITYGGAKNIQGVTWLQDYNPPADEALYKWVPPLKYWYGKDEDANGVKDGVYEELSAEDMLKYWGWGIGSDETATHNPEDNPVLMISNSMSYTENSTSDGGTTDPADPADPGVVTGIQYISKVAKAYYGMENHFDETTKKWVNYPKEEVADEGTLYCRNSGWLLIPPQESFGKLTLCFTTKKGEQAIYKVVLPSKTGTLIDKNGKVMKDAAGKFITESKDGRDAWVAGVRYTYVVTLSETDLGVDVTIDPWNERKHSTEIIF